MKTGTKRSRSGHETVTECCRLRRAELLRAELRRRPRFGRSVLARDGRLGARQRTASWLAALCSALLALAEATAAPSIASRSDSEPYPGVRIAEIRTSSPATNVRAAFIDLCHDYIHVDARSAPSSLRSTGSWGDAMGVQLAVNGDFYRTGPVRVYGDAVGSGVRWPSRQTGAGTEYSWEWFHEKYGWIAFGPGSVTYNHTEWVKFSSGIELSGGWRNGDRRPDPPADTIALVSGFPELVTEGRVRTCADPTATSCFPDRGDMKDRHPRTAMGLTEDMQTFILVTVDGRTSRSSGMRGAELAWLMGELGAWQAFNLDGGGSSQMWLEGDGYINDASGNNGGGFRSVANHWGVFAGAASGMPIVPGHCVGEYEPCETIGRRGGVLEETGPCFQSFGPLRFWRTVDDDGHGGHLLWTNAFSSDTPSNWARWNLHFEAAGEYRVDAYVDGDWGVWSETRYELRTAGGDRTVTANQSRADGWMALGTFDFDAGGGQWVSVFDNYSGSIPSDQHIAVDAIRLTRLGCVDELCNGRDDDCDGVVPDDERDRDGDGVMACDGDCDDRNADIHPGADEACNGIDDDCDGELPGREQDRDGDGVSECDGDCNDGDDTIHPGAEERCNGVDDDCDGEEPVDEGVCPADPTPDAGTGDAGAMDDAGPADASRDPVETTDDVSLERDADAAHTDARSPDAQAVERDTDEDGSAARDSGPKPADTGAEGPGSADRDTSAHDDGEPSDGRPAGPRQIQVSAGSGCSVTAGSPHPPRASLLLLGLAIWFWRRASRAPSG